MEGPFDFLKEASLLVVLHGTGKASVTSEAAFQDTDVDPVRVIPLLVTFQRYDGIGQLAQGA